MKMMIGLPAVQEALSGPRKQSVGPTGLQPASQPAADHYQVLTPADGSLSKLSLGKALGGRCSIQGRMKGRIRRIRMVLPLNGTTWASSYCLGAGCEGGIMTQELPRVRGVCLRLAAALSSQAPAGSNLAAVWPQPQEIGLSQRLKHCAGCVQGSAITHQIARALSHTQMLKAAGLPVSAKGLSQNMGRTAPK